MFKVAKQFDLEQRAVVYQGDCLQLLRQIPDQSIQLVVTSPPYNVGKSYEKSAAFITTWKTRPA